MKKFDINRFYKVMSRLILIRRRSIIKLFAGFLIGFFVIAIMFFPFFERQPMSDAYIRIRLWGITPFINIVFAMSLFTIATFVISDLGKRQQRINEMMLPATNIEKFWHVSYLFLWFVHCLLPSPLSLPMDCNS